MRRMHALTIAGPREVTVDVPVQYFQSVIALETAVRARAGITQPLGGWWRW
jgi:hypothetical protein